MSHLRAIIVEDEPSGLENLRFKLQQNCPEIDIVAECTSGSEAILAIKKLLPDILFLDIQLGDMTGFDVLDKIKHPSFEVIFTTSYDDYAIQAIKNNALDYLLKPILVEELLDAVAKAHSKFRNNQTNTSTPSPSIPRASKMGFPISTGKQFFDIEDIIYAEAEDNVAKLHIKEVAKPVKLTKSLGWLEDELDHHGFCRVHHSYLINFHHLTEYIRNEGGYVILSNGKAISVARRRKDHFLNSLEKWNLQL